MTDRIRGLDNVIQLLKESIGWSADHHAIARELRLSSSSGVLLHGPAGCGKSMLVKAIAADFSASLHTVVASEIFDAVTGQSEERLRNAFRKAQEAALKEPVILFFDEVDALCPKRTSGEEHEKRVVAQLLTLLDGICQHPDSGRRLFIIAASNRPEAIDPALRRAGRLDREIFIPLPTREAREAILALHTAAMPLSPSCDLASLAAASNGYSSSDLVALCREASIAAMSRMSLTASSCDGGEPGEEAIQQADFKAALNAVKSVTSRRNADGPRSVQWDDIGGLKAAKQRLVKGVVWPVRHAKSLHRLGLGPPRGILIEGPPGCAKTTLIQAAITASGASCQMLTAAQLYSSLAGEGEALLRAAFSAARSTAPSIIFIDELDTIAGSRGGQHEGSGGPQLLTSLLTEIDGLENSEGVLVLSATNRREAIDPALLRPGRFDVSVRVSVPDAEGRLAIMKIHCKDYNLGSDVDLEDISERMSGFTGADIESVCREAGIAALHERLQATALERTKCATVSAHFFIEAIQSCSL